MPDLEVSWLQPRPEDGSVTIRVSSNCNLSALVRWEQANSRGFWDSILLWLRQSTDWEFRLKVSWCGESLSSASYVDHGLTAVTHRQQGGTWCSAEGVPATSGLTIRLFWLRYSVPFFSCKACQGTILKGHCLPSLIMEAFNRNESPPKSQRPFAKAIPPLLGSNPRKASNRNPSHKRQIPLWNNLPWVAITPSFSCPGFCQDKILVSVRTPPF